MKHPLLTQMRVYEIHELFNFKYNLVNKAYVLVTLLHYETLLSIINLTLYKMSL